MKLSKEEMLNRVNSLELNDEIKVALMEDISDSMEKNEENVVDETIVEGLKNEVEELKWKYDNLLGRYKERFINGDPEEEPEPDVEEEFKEEEKIDIKEI